MSFRTPAAMFVETVGVAVNQTDMTNLLMIPLFSKDKEDGRISTETCLSVYVPDYILYINNYVNIVLCTTLLTNL